VGISRKIGLSAREHSARGLFLFRERACHATLRYMSVFQLHGAEGHPTKRIDYAAKLNQEQLSVVLGGDGARLVLAGAGSGKTRTLTYRVAYLLEQGVDPSSILLLTFTNKASKEMLSRVASLLGVEAKGLWGGTFHSIGARLLRHFACDVGYEPTFSILDQEDSRVLVKAVMKDLKIDPKARRFPKASVVANIVSYARNTQQSIQEVLEIKHQNFLELANDIEEIAQQYQERKKRSNVMDFDDLLTNLVRLLDDATLGRRISERFRYVLVDEYQDTNMLQARIVHGFARVNKNILVVGDDAQSIYAFRGADVKNILNFPKEWPESTIFKLLHNYRSTPQILDLANESLSHNVEQFKKELFSTREEGESPRLVPCSSAAQEAKYIAEQILSLRNEGTALENIAVLFRSSAHSQQLEFELLKRDIPYEYRGGQKFFERAHIKDIVAFLRIYENPEDEIAWLRTLGLQTGIGAVGAEKILQLVRQQDSTESAVAENALSVPKRTESGWKDFSSIMRALVKEARLPAQMIRAINASSYQDYLEREYPNWKDRLEDLEQLALFAESYEDLTAFLVDISLYDEVVATRETDMRGDDERMVLSTIHQAKGLEWDTVFIIHLAEGSFPNHRALAEEDGLEEERRLFYVAVTRARKNLLLTYPMTVGHGSLAFNQPSTFIDEVSTRLFERIEVREPWQRFGRGVKNADMDDAGEDAHWSWEGTGWEEPTIEINQNGERQGGTASKNVWKSMPSNRSKAKPGSFLRDIDEL